GNGELCVCELEKILGINQSNASRHLNKLASANIILYEKRALYVYYRINEEIYKKYPFLKELILKELKDYKKCGQDTARLNIFKRSGISCEDLVQDKDNM
ncbi:MAG: ArsR/SmtB family transcription factor, partial [Caulobacteraceae bacterium]